MRNFSKKIFAKYLGVYFDNNFIWKKHIEMIKPFTEYGVLAWGGAPKTHLIKIERSLNKAVRIMLFKGKSESAQPLFQYLNSVHRYT